MVAVVTVTGNVGLTASKKTTQSGQEVVEFSVASYVSPEKTDWYRVSVWRKLNDSVFSKLTKGTRVTVIGRLEQREYTAKDGTVKTQLQINCSELDVAFNSNNEPQQQSQRQQPQQQSQAQAQPQNNNDFVDIPF